MLYTCESSRWRALTLRDPSANGHFVYCVKSTGIYCRPTCSARLARRANVLFYKSPFEAEAAGFRPCKRCQPRLEQEVDPAANAVEKAREILRKEAERASEQEKNESGETLKLKDLAGMVGLTNSYFHKIFRQRTGMTPKNYLDNLRSYKDEVVTNTYPGEGAVDTAGEESHHAISTAIGIENVPVPALEDFRDWSLDPSGIGKIGDTFGDQTPASDLVILTNDQVAEGQPMYSLQPLSGFDHGTIGGPNYLTIVDDGLFPGEWPQLAAAPIHPSYSLGPTIPDLLREPFVDDLFFWNEDVNFISDNFEKPSALS